MITSTPSRSGAGNTTTHSKSNVGRQCSDNRNHLQAVAQRMDEFHRLQTAFNAAGWNFHPLDDRSFLAVHRRWQMHHVCQSVGDALRLLNRIGGAA